jgi:hypothetical protein
VVLVLPLQPAPTSTVVLHCWHVTAAAVCGVVHTHHRPRCCCCRLMGFRACAPPVQVLLDDVQAASHRCLTAAHKVWVELWVSGSWRCQLAAWPRHRLLHALLLPAATDPPERLGGGLCQQPQVYSVCVLAILQVLLWRPGICINGRWCGAAAAGAEGRGAHLQSLLCCWVWRLVDALCYYPCHAGRRLRARLHSLECRAANNCCQGVMASRSELQCCGREVCPDKTLVSSSKQPDRF